MLVYWARRVLEQPAVAAAIIGARLGHSEHIAENLQAPKQYAIPATISRLQVAGERDQGGGDQRDQRYQS